MKLVVNNFRSHQHYQVEFTAGMNIITGPNGSGKTTLLEAIYVALMGKSWRSNFDEMVRQPADEFNWWRIDLMRDDAVRTVKYQAGAKTFIINDHSYHRFPTSQRVPVLLFEPNDMQMLYGSPSRRRDFFDRAISVLDPAHQTEVNKFARVLRQRNSLLKQDYCDPSELLVWDIQFSQLSAQISARRRRLVQLINQSIATQYQSIAGRSDTVELKFQAGAPATVEHIMTELRRSYDDVTTPVGAQKDDFEFRFNHKAAKLNASRGENRTILFALLAVIADVVRQHYPEAVILLDDIDSELDAAHRANLYATDIFQHNTIATTLSYSGSDYHHIELS